MPRHDPATPASDETAFENTERVLRECHGDRGPKLFSFGSADFDRAMLMAHVLNRLVRRHSLSRRIGGISS